MFPGVYSGIKFALSFKFVSRIFTVKKSIVTGILLLCTAMTIEAQTSPQIVVRATIFENDTIPLINLNPVTIYGLPVFKNKKDQRQWEKLVRNVKKVYPYARLAGIKFQEYENLILTSKSEKERKKYVNRLEKELTEQYSDELEKLTFTQGKILFKLLDRETGNSSYELVKELKGKFMAFFWHSFARIFGYNLKEKYDPYGKDVTIEQIVVLIENGAL